MAITGLLNGTYITCISRSVVIIPTTRSQPEHYDETATQLLRSLLFLSLYIHLRVSNLINLVNQSTSVINVFFRFITLGEVLFLTQQSSEGLTKLARMQSRGPTRLKHPRRTKKFTISPPNLSGVNLADPSSLY